MSVPMPYVVMVERPGGTQVYRLCSKEVTLTGGRTQVIHFFIRAAGSEPASEPGLQVVETLRNTMTTEQGVVIAQAFMDHLLYSPEGAAGLVAQLKATVEGLDLRQRAEVAEQIFTALMNPEASQ